MKLHSRAKQYIVFLLAFLMAFEPFAVNMVYASSIDPNDGIDEVEKFKVEEEDGLENITDKSGFEALDIMKPADYLNYIVSLRGRSVSDNAQQARAQEKAIAWGEWMNTISGAYSLMDDGCTDVFTFYDALGESCNTKEEEETEETKRRFIGNKTGAAVDTVSNLLVEKDKFEVFKKGLAFAADKAFLAGAFLAKITRIDKIAGKVANWVKSKDCLVKGFAGMGQLYNRAAKPFVDGSKTFISHMCPPANIGETKQYWSWVKKTTSKAPKAAEVVKNNSTPMTWNQFQHANAGKYTRSQMSQAWKDYKATNTSAANSASEVTSGMSKVQGVAHTVGIGLQIIGIACDSYAIFDSAQNGDIAGGEAFSYDMVKTYVSLAFGIAGLIAMFCIPVVGQVLAVLTLIWTALTIIGDEIGKYNKKWKEAYKNSYWFLYENDPEFKSYYDNRDDLIEDEKSAAYCITERNYAGFKQNARNHEKEYKGKNDYYDKMDQEAITARVYIELEKQGVVTSYYNRSSFKMPDYSMSRLLDMWKAKADYMSWKPTEEESVRAENRGFWGTIGHAINPMTYVSWVGDKVKSIDYNNFAKYNIQKVYFNPDFVLIKKYQTWITANRKMYVGEGEINNTDFYRAIGLRIEQSPFNYIPLVAIDMAAWNDDLLVDAFNCDAYIVAGKEMAYFKNVVETAAQNIENSLDENVKTFEEMKDSLDIFTKKAVVLSDLQNKYSLDSTRKSKEAGEKFFKEHKKEIKKYFGWTKENVGSECTPENIMKVYWNDINMTLAMDPITVGKRAVECKLMIDSIQRNIDTYAMMKQLLDEKRNALDNVGNRSEGGFKPDSEFYRFVKENTFLNVDGGGFFDWLSGLRSPWKELDYNTNLYEKKLNEYNEAVAESLEGHKKILWFKVKSEDHAPIKIYNQFKDTLNTYKQVSEQYADEKFRSKLKESGLDDSNLYVSHDDKKVYDIEALEGEVKLEQLDPTERFTDSDMENMYQQSTLIPAGDTDF
jgi:hypothetical protein